MQNMRKGVKAYVDELRKLGAKKVGVYIGHHLYKSFNIDTNDFDAVWIPYYGKNDGTPNSKPAYPCDLHQYTSVGRLDGYNGNLDLNRILSDKPLSFFTGKKDLLVVDGYWGPATTKALQRYLETLVDGVISGQYKNQITTVIPSARFGPPYTGSMVIRALQKKIGAKVDGFIDPETVRALQRYLGTPVDGVISRPSLMVKELQRRLNAGKI